MDGRWRALLAFLVAGLCLVLGPGVSRAQVTGTVTILHSFTNGSDGAQPISGLTLDSDGNFYGTTYADVDNDFGTVFRITPTGVLTTLYTITDSTYASSGENEHPNVLILGSDGNFYGTVYSDSDAGFGAIFELTPAGAFTTIHDFAVPVRDGNSPNALVEGNDGNFYGTTLRGSSLTPGGVGTIFKTTPAGAFKTLYNFTAADDEEYPNSLILGSDGNFYGTTAGEGEEQFGTVFRITPDGVFTTIYTFTNGSDGSSPNSLVVDSDGNFYGTTSGNTRAQAKFGTIFQLTPSGLFSTIHTFNGSSDGASPNALVLGKDGNFYGTTNTGGANNGGTAFQITPAGVLTTLYTFGGSGGGIHPNKLLQASDGNFYGTTYSGGSSSDGTVFKLVLSSYMRPAFFNGETALSNGVYYLGFPNGNYFGYYSFLSDPNYIYHFDLGYEYVFDAKDGKSGVYLYDFKSGHFFYSSPVFPFPYLYDFTLNSTLYYYPDPSNAGHYNTNGVRYFYDFANGKIISQ